MDQAAAAALDTRISLRRLEVFTLVVEEGGVTRAAERLLVAQPAVSAQLRALEQNLRARLFVRSAGRLILTEVGERVYQWAKDVLAGGVQLQRDVVELADGLAGSVVVNASMAIGTYLLPPLFSELRLRRPGADLTVLVDWPARALESVEHGEADFGVISWTEDEVPPTMVAERLRDEPIVLCASPDGPPDTDEINVADLSRLPTVGVPREVAYYRMLDAQLHAHGVGSLSAEIRFGHAEPMKRAVMTHGWVTLLPRYCVLDELASGRLREVRIRDAEFVEGIGLYRRRTKHFSPLQRAAIGLIRGPHKQSAM
jgi:LysR family transcriptional regulator, low CO2-responsive transcriptional regulator